MQRAYCTYTPPCLTHALLTILLLLVELTILTAAFDRSRLLRQRARGAAADRVKFLWGAVLAAWPPCVPGASDRARRVIAVRTWFIEGAYCLHHSVALYTLCCLICFNERIVICFCLRCLSSHHTTALSTTYLQPKINLDGLLFPVLSAVFVFSHPFTPSKNIRYLL